MDFTIISLIISSVALLISFYFSFISSCNTKLDRYNDCITEIDRIIINNPELMDIYDESKIKKRKYDTIYISKIEAFIFLHFNYFENAYFHFLRKRSFLFKRQKDAWQNFIIEVFKNSFCGELFNENQKLYDKKFVIYIKKLLPKSDDD